MGHFVAVMPRFPARVVAGDGIVIEKTGITYTFSLAPEVAPTPGEGVVDKGTVTSGIVTFNWSDSTKQKLTVGGALTVAFTGWPASGRHGEMEIELVNGGAFAVTWPTVHWVFGDGTNSVVFGDMSVALQAADSNWVIIWTRNGGTTLWGKAG